LTLQRFAELETGTRQLEIVEPEDRRSRLPSPPPFPVLKSVGYQADRTVLFVDQPRADQVEQYQLTPDAAYELFVWTDFHSYRQPIDPLFHPEDVPQV
jgi:hypothetical protein